MSDENSLVHRSKGHVGVPTELLERVRQILVRIRFTYSCPTCHVVLTFDIDQCVTCGDIVVPRERRLLEFIVAWVDLLDYYMENTYHQRIRKSLDYLEGTTSKDRAVRMATWELRSLLGKDKT